MQDDPNPYAAPSAPLQRSIAEEDLLLWDASLGARFGNAVIDWIGMMVLAFVVGVVCVLVGFDFESLPGLVFNYGVAFAYYAGFECTLHQTPSKWLTKTRVVRADGGVPSTKQMLIRSLSRLVPFDALSFIGGPPGWHDSWSGTRVIRTKPPAGFKLE